MKKYFMKGTEDELQFGDLVELDITEDMPNGKIKHKHLDCKFMPDLIDTLLEAEVIEEVDVDDEEEEEEETTDEVCPMMQELIVANENLELKVEQLEKELNSLKKVVAALVA
jgi:hypothetical protein